MNYRDIQEQVLQAALTSNRLGLIHGTSGNISLRCPGRDMVAITPSSTPYDQLTAEDIALVDLDGNWLEGPRKPSCETPMHTSVFRARPDVMAVVHTHSLFATVMSMRMEVLRGTTVTSNAYYPIKTASPFALPGSQELARIAVETLGEEGDVILLKNHGLLATGGSIEEAMTCAIYTEECAQVAYYAALIAADGYIPMEGILACRDMVKKGKAV